MHNVTLVSAVITLAALLVPQSPIAYGGPVHAPWRYVQRGDQFVVELQRAQGPSGSPAVVAEVAVGKPSTGGEADAIAVLNTWLQAVEKGDAETLQRVFDDAYVIVSGNGSRRTKAQEIADLVTPGAAIPYFRSEGTETRAFGDVAITTGLLKWQLRPGGNELQRQYTSVAVRRPGGWRIVTQQVTMPR